MKIASSTMQTLTNIITGDSRISPYRSGTELENFFNQYDKLCGLGGLSRGKFTCAILQELNGTKSIQKIIEDVLDPRHYLKSEFDVSAVVEHLNQYLIPDGFEAVKKGHHYRLIAKDADSVITVSFTDKFSTQDNHSFILEQSNKCKEKLESRDYDGAITNARSMVEAVFEAILIQAEIEIPRHDGDLNKLYKEVKKYLNLDPGKEDLTETLKQILSGLNSIVCGIAGISNKMGDRHSRKYKPEKYHASFTIVAAHGMCEFLISSLEHQYKTGKIKTKCASGTQGA